MGLSREADCHRETEKLGTFIQENCHRSSRGQLRIFFYAGAVFSVAGGAYENFGASQDPNVTAD